MQQIGTFLQITNALKRFTQTDNQNAVSIDEFDANSIEQVLNLALKKAIDATSFSRNLFFKGTAARSHKKILFQTHGAEDTDSLHRYSKQNILRIKQKFHANKCSHVGKHPRYSQKIGRNWLVDPKSKSAYCFNHKAASTTWMAVFTKLYGDKEFLEQAEKSQMYYP